MFAVRLLALYNSTCRTCTSASAAIDAAISVDYILAISFRNSTYWTSASTSATHNTRIVDYVCHNLVPPYIIVLVRKLY